VQLTPLAEEHLPLLDALISDPETLRFTRIPEPPPPGFARQWLDAYEAGRRDGTREAFAAFDDEERFVGLALAPAIESGAREAELGYIVTPDARTATGPTQPCCRGCPRTQRQLQLGRR
jgi:RimJ/RimL family protein N-acetyltransferase